MSTDANSSDAGEIANVMQETRLFPPSAEFSASARIASMQEYEELYQRSIADPPAFWADQALQNLHWFEPFTEALIWEEPVAQWFVGGKTNLSFNCLDRHLNGPRKNQAAILWEGEPGDQRVFTYQLLHREVCKFANVLKNLGIRRGDVVSIYMPMVPELAIAMLACVRIGAIHSVIFAGFSSEAIAERNNDAQAKLQITSDGGWRRGTQLQLKRNVDEALEKSPSVEKCVVLRRVGLEIHMKPGRDFWWHDLINEASDECPAEPLDSETPSFILYTSGSTGKPKGIMHTTAGYNLYTLKSFQWVFDHRDDDIYWCTADCGWITGHSYIVYGPLAAGAAVVMYEGAPNHPDVGRFWDIVQKYRVTVFYTAPTAVRAFMKWGRQWPDKHDLSSLRLMGSVGEGINPEAWMWYYEVIGGNRCPIVDTWWQTETGGIMMSPLPGATSLKPGSCTKPLPGVIPKIMGNDGTELPQGSGGMLCVAHPWPGMLRGLWGDPERFQSVYWSRVPHMYLTGDNARQDSDGDYWIMGRIDDVINVSGHRLSTIEVESALVSHPFVAEAAVVGRPDELRGQAIAAFITLRGGEPGESLKDDLKQHVRHAIGAHATPTDIHFAKGLPKTRSGKIMRRLLRDIACGKEVVQDTTTLEDYSVLAQLRSED